MSPHGSPHHRVRRLPAEPQAQQLTQAQLVQSLIAEELARQPQQDARSPVGRSNKLLGQQPSPSMQRQQSAINLEDKVHTSQPTSQSQQQAAQQSQLHVPSLAESLVKLTHAPLAWIDPSSPEDEVRTICVP